MAFYGESGLGGARQSLPSARKLKVKNVKEKRSIVKCATGTSQIGRKILPEEKCIIGNKKQGEKNRL